MTGQKRPYDETLSAFSVMLDAIKASGTVVRIVETAEEAAAIDAEMEAKGMRLAVMSNAGLTGTKRRMTFLPASAFKKGQE